MGERTKLVSLRPPSLEPVPEVLAVLAELVTLAQAGRIRSIAGAYTIDGTASRFASDVDDGDSLLGALGRQWLLIASLVNESEGEVP